MQRQTSLSGNIVQFCRYLRRHEFVVGVAEEATALAALQFIDYGKAETFRLALRAVLCRSESQMHRFDELYHTFWIELSQAVDSKEKKRERKGAKASPEASFKTLKSWLHNSSNGEEEQTAAYSPQERLTQKDFSLVPADEIPELMRIVKTFAKRLARQANRRCQRSNKIAAPDLRRTLRLNMRRGGELLHLAYRKPKRNRTRVVLLCDVSKSMELYTAFFLQFMYAFQQVYSRMETFAFGTSLQHLTLLFRQQDFESALRQVNRESESWSGGTQIGECLDRFVRLFASKFVNRQTIVLILSDGWDGGDKGRLAKNMERIHTSAKKLIWLNPLAGYAGYLPATAGMQAAMPFIDVFLPVHNADSLRKLRPLL